MLDMCNEIFRMREDNSKAISALVDQLKELTEQVNQQPSDNPLDIYLVINCLIKL